MGYTISIAKTEYRKDGGEKYILYIIEVRDGNNLIVEVRKRFSQLKALHEAVNKEQTTNLISSGIS